MMTQPQHSIPYPTTLGRFALRMPLTLFRLGLGELLNLLRLMVLTTRGRKSGKARYAAVEYRRHGSKIYIISAWGGRPDWYQNLLTDPLVTIQLGREKVSALADKVTDPAEAARALNLFRQDAPARYDAVLGRLIEDEVSGSKLRDVSEQFTVVRLDIIGDEPLLPGLTADLIWLWPVALVGLAVVIAAAKRTSSEK
ncbi:MAG: nitroreductase family deazaflavin-dependent oxidoreductase [Chloroflexi bacterium]|nr:nitroreductase family deazaflavin-dependent oxidoreductase [Chloroflexota bacterium]MCC6893723.1 nitroreductase family deazaflavin-dependent oxidoreductase [Anaerolineae bacterium]